MDIPLEESITVEFKSDRSCLSDDDLVCAVVCMANAKGGDVWLGIEDDGTPTGLHVKRRNVAGLAGLVAARTSPSLQVDVSQIKLGGVVVVRIQVPVAVSATSTMAGLFVRRRLKHDGSPECAPMLPHDITSRAGYFGKQDLSAEPVVGAKPEDFDPIERERLRQAISTFGGDRSLLDLDDEALEGALGFVRRSSAGVRTPTLTGMLFLGREASLRQFVPVHDLAFQVFEGESLLANEFRHFPLLKLLDWIEGQFSAHNTQQEVQVDLFRVPIPKVEPRAFREAIANALLHRDYTRMGAVHVQLKGDELSISNPGGLVEGVTLANLLVTEPRPRNPALADALKRIGLVERSGRGVDVIVRGALRFGRPTPDYGETSESSVILKLSAGTADKDFLKVVVQEESRRGSPLPIDGLIALAAIRKDHRLSPAELALRTQRDISSAKRTLETLVEAGLIQAHGITPRTRSYTLSAAVYSALGDKAAFTRQAGFSSIQHQQMVLSFVREHGKIQRSDIVGLCRITAEQAKVLISKLKSTRELIQHGQKRGTFYTLGPGSD